MVDRLCEIIEENQRSLQELAATNEDLEEQLQDFRQWVTSLQGEISDLNEGKNNERI
jgi:prefoldin subunit 5